MVSGFNWGSRTSSTAMVEPVWVSATPPAMLPDNGRQVPSGVGTSPPTVTRKDDVDRYAVHPCTQPRTAWTAASACAGVP